MSVNLYAMEFNIDTFHPFVLNIGLAQHNADWNWKNVSSPFARLYYVIEGSAKIILPDHTVSLRKGYMYFIPAFTSHSYECTSSFTHYYAHIYEDPQAKYLFLEDWVLPEEIQGDTLELSIFQELYSLNPTMKLSKSDPSTYDNSSTLASNLLKNKQRPLYNKMISRGIIYQLLAPFFKTAHLKSTVTDDRVKKAITYIRNHISDELCIDKVAETLCVSKNYFIRIFKKETGTTPANFIIQRKIEKAQLLLITNDLPVKQTSYLVGFEDFSYFNRVFKKITGMTPNEYRREAKSQSVADGKYNPNEKSLNLE